MQAADQTAVHHSGSPDSPLVRTTARRPACSTTGASRRAFSRVSSPGWISGRCASAQDRPLEVAQDDPVGLAVRDEYLSAVGQGGNALHPVGVYVIFASAPENGPAEGEALDEPKVGLDVLPRGAHHLGEVRERAPAQGLYNLPLARDAVRVAGACGTPP